MLSLVNGRSRRRFIYELSRVGRTFWNTLDAIKAVERYASLISCSPRESFSNYRSQHPAIMIGILTWAEREQLHAENKGWMHRARQAGKGIGRPQKTVDKDKLITMGKSLKNKNSQDSRLVKAYSV